jgi:hypothetical protein
MHLVLCFVLMGCVILIDAANKQKSSIIFLPLSSRLQPWGATSLQVVPVLNTLCR